MQNLEFWHTVVRCTSIIVNIVAINNDMMNISLNIRLTNINPVKQSVNLAQ